MANSSFSKLYRNEILTNMSKSRMNEQDAYVRQKIAPFVQVNKESGDIVSYGKQALRLLDDRRAIGGRYKEVKTMVEATNHYRLKDYGLMEKIFEEDVENADKPINAEIDATEIVTSKVMVAAESRIAGAINATNITQNTALIAATQWDNYTSATSDPLKTIDDARRVIHKSTGKWANNLLVSCDVLYALKNHPKILARFPGAVLITDQMIKDALASLFGIQNFIIASALYLGENEPSEGDLDYIWNNIALLYYSEPAPRLKSLSFMKTYAKRGGLEVLRAGATESEYLAEKLYSQIRVSNYYDQVIVEDTCAFLIEDVVS